MTKKTGRIIMIIGIAICAIAFGTSLAIAFSYFNNADLKSAIFYGIAWIVFAILSLLVIIPFIMIGKLADDIDGQNKKIKTLADTIKRFERNMGYDLKGVTQYSPVVRMGTTQPGIDDESENTTEETKPMGEATAILRAALTESDYSKTVVTPVQTDEGTRQDVNYESPTSVFSSSSGTVQRGASKTEIIDSVKAKEKVAQIFSDSTTQIDAYSLDRRTTVITRKLFIQPNSTIAAGGYHTVAIREDGTVQAAGSNDFGQCEVDGWTNCVAIAAGMYHTVAVRENGTCYACGFHGQGEYNQCDVSSWRNVLKVACGKSHTVALLGDGTCIGCGDNTYNQRSVQEWTDIIDISAGDTFTVGLKADGTCVAVGTNTDSKSGVMSWGNMVSVTAGGFHTVGLRNDGTLVATGNNANNQCDVKNMKNITQIAAGNYHTVALKTDGKVLAVGANGARQCEVNTWYDIVAIAAGRNHTIGLTKNGKLLAVGESTRGQCEMDEFKNLRVVNLSTPIEE